MKSFQFESTKSIVNQVGGTRLLASFCLELGITKPLLVTDQGIVALGLHKSALESLNASGQDYAIYSGVQADPSESVLLEALDFAREEGVDGVVGLGGGSSMDIAKLVAVMLPSNQPIAEIFGVNNVSGQRLPLIQVPTTAGTGSEVTPIAIITTGETTKNGVVAPQLLPDLALLDAELTLGLPPAITAATGIDAMVHAIEAYTSALKKNPYSDMLAREALALMAPNLEKAVHDGTNIQARSAMMLGATLAGQAFANAPVAAVHALAYPLGGHFHIPHGLSNSLVLPHVMAFNAVTAAPLYAELAPVIMQHGAELKGSDAVLCERLISYLNELIVKLDLPTTLKSVNIAAEKLPILAKDALQQTRLLVNNPRKVTERDALNIYQAAYE